MYFSSATCYHAPHVCCIKFPGKMLFQGNVYNKNVLLVSQQYYLSFDSIVRIISMLINTHLPFQIGTYVVEAKNSHAHLLTLIKQIDSSDFLVEFDIKDKKCC